MCAFWEKGKGEGGILEGKITKARAHMRMACGRNQVIVQTYLLIGKVTSQPFDENLLVTMGVGGRDVGEVVDTRVDRHVVSQEKQA